MCRLFENLNILCNLIWGLHTVYHGNPIYISYWYYKMFLAGYRQHRTSNTHKTEHIDNSLMVDPIEGCAEINFHDPSLHPLTNALYSVWDKHKSASQVPKPYRYASWAVGSTSLRFINCPRLTDIKRSNTLDNTEARIIGVIRLPNNI